MFKKLNQEFQYPQKFLDLENLFNPLILSQIFYNVEEYFRSENYVAVKIL